MTPLEGQILDELSRRLESLGELVGRDLVDLVLYRLSGLSEASTGDRAHSAEQIAEVLIGSDRESARRQATALLAFLFPHPAEPEPEWWRTALGKACIVHSLELYPARVSAPRAASILGVSVARVYQLADPPGTPQRPGSPPRLVRHEEGGVTWESVAARVADDVTPVAQPATSPATSARN